MTLSFDETCPLTSIQGTEMTDRQDLSALVERIDQHFRSGNSVPIDKAWVRRDDWIALREAAAQPDGWVLVPRALTEEMEIAWCEAWFSKRRPIDDPQMADCWEAMLAAAPQPVKATQQPMEQLSESEKDVALGQAVELATYVERQAKGEMVKAAKRFLSLPYAQEIAARLAKRPGDRHE